jgi:hypothetical protein
MDGTMKTEIREKALGYPLKYRSNNHLMKSYLAPAYLQLRQRHPELRYEEFIEELVKVREQARKSGGVSIINAS